MRRPSAASAKSRAASPRPRSDCQCARWRKFGRYTASSSASSGQRVSAAFVSMQLASSLCKAAAKKPHTSA